MVGEEGREAALRTLGERAVWRDVLPCLLWCLNIPKSSFGFYKNRLLVSGLYSSPVLWVRIKEWGLHL